MISHIKLVSIPVTDQSKALEFYTEKLGFEVVVDEPYSGRPDERWIELRLPEGQTRVVLLKTNSNDAHRGTRSNIVFTARDIEETYLQLKVKGVSFKEPPNRQPWGQFTQFSDPDGNIFVLASG